MTTIYEASRKTLKVSGIEGEIPFYCGDNLDALSSTLIALKYRNLSLQDAYIYLSRWMLESALKGEMSLAAQEDGEPFVSKKVITF